MSQIKEDEIDTGTEHIPEENTDELEDAENSFFAGAENPREYYEGVEDEDLDTEDEELGEDEEHISLTNPQEDDIAHFKMAMGLVDSTRAMGLSLFVDGSLDNVDKYIFYSDWNDPKHAATLEAGAVVARKYKFSAFQAMPEFMLLLGIVISTAALFKMAKDDKKEAKEKEAEQQARAAQAQQNSNIRPINNTFQKAK